MLAGRIAAEGSCAQARDIPRLGRLALELVNEHRVPPGLQEPFVSGVNALVAQAPRCTTGEGPTATTPPHIVTSSIAPVPHAATPAQQARNLQAWLSTWSH